MIGVLDLETSRRLWAAGWRPEGEHLAWSEVGRPHLVLCAPPAEQSREWQPTCTALEALEWLWSHIPTDFRVCWDTRLYTNEWRAWLPNRTQVSAGTALGLVVAILDAMEAAQRPG